MLTPQIGKIAWLYAKLFSMLNQLQFLHSTGRHQNSRIWVENPHSKHNIRMISDLMETIYFPKRWLFAHTGSESKLSSLPCNKMLPFHFVVWLATSPLAHMSWQQLVASSNPAPCKAATLCCALGCSSAQPGLDRKLLKTCWLNQRGALHRSLFQILLI